jgi:esterase
MQERVLPAILVHGFLDAGEIWGPVIEIVGQEAADWSTPDLAGMGSRWQDAGPFTLRRMAEELGAYIDRIGSPVILVGHSMGSQLVELAARCRPGLVRGLLLLSPIPLAGMRLPPEMSNALSDVGGDLAAQRETRLRFMGQPVDLAVLERLVAIGSKVRREATRAIVTA